MIDAYFLADDGRLYGTARGGLVANPETDLDFQAWRARNSGPAVVAQTEEGSPILGYALGEPSPWPMNDDGEQTQGALDDLLGAAPGPQSRVITPLQFMERLSQVKRIAIRSAAKQEGAEALDDWLDLLRAAQEVDLDDPRTTGGVAAMVAAGLLTQDEADDLLA